MKYLGSILQKDGSFEYLDRTDDENAKGLSGVTKEDIIDSIEMALIDCRMGDNK